MRIIIFGILLHFTTASFSQIKTFKVIDSVSQRPLELATVRFLNSDYTAFTDADGVLVTIPEGEFNAEVSYIGYRSKMISLNSNSTLITLQPAAEELCELVLQTKKNYTGSRTIKSASASEYFGFQFGTEHCTFIANTAHQAGKVSSITLHLNRMKPEADMLDRVLANYKDCKGCKMDYIASYMVMLYEYDSIAKKPGRELYSRGIVANPKNKSYRFTIDLDSLDIPFSKDGVCVGIEVINTRYTKPKTTFAFIGPFLGFYYYKNNNEPKSWIRYRNEGRDFKNVVSGFDKGKLSKALAVDVAIKI